MTPNPDRPTPARGVDRPSRRFRRPSGESATLAPPGLLAMAGAIAATGALAGLLELATFAVQVHVLHRVDESSLRISRHVGWMIPAAEFAVVVPLAALLIGPGLLWSRRSGRETGPGSPRWAWAWAGFVLATLASLGPMLAIRGLHPLAALALAIGAGLRLRGLAARPTPGWARAATWSGFGAIVLLPGLGLWHGARVAGAGDRALALPPIDAPNLVWIVLDTVRADRLSLYGYPRPTTPGLERWAREGITFDEARSAAPWTLPSHVSMFTGLWPSQHHARIDHPYVGSPPTIAEYLGELGYKTAGFAANTGMCNACFGVGRGFDHYVELTCNHEVSPRAAMLNSALGRRALWALRKLKVPVPTEFPHPGRSLAPKITGRARGWLDSLAGLGSTAQGPGSGRPYFLFLNFMDAHGPYVPRDDQPRTFSGDRPLPPRPRCNPTAGLDALHALATSSEADRPRFEAELAETTRLLGDLYDDCLVGLDDEVSRFLDGLAADGLLDTTWVVVTADHGEYLGERGLFGHGGRLHNEVTHVPLLVLPPRGDSAAAKARGLRVATPATLRDLPATFAELLVPDRPHPFPGRSLARHWDDPSAAPDGAHDPIRMEMDEQAITGKDVAAEAAVESDALVLDGYILLTTPGRADELYRLNDRRQERDLAADPVHVERIARMKRVLAEGL